jgi:hypothetical protein
MVVTIVEAEVPPEQERSLTDRWSEVTSGPIPPGLVRTFLLRSGGTWRIATVWESHEVLAAMRASTDTPAAVAIFRSVGVDPTVTIWDVADHVEPSD